MMIVPIFHNECYVSCAAFYTFIANKTFQCLSFHRCSVSFIWRQKVRIISISRSSFYHLHPVNKKKLSWLNTLRKLKTNMVKQLTATKRAQSNTIIVCTILLVILS